MPGWDSLKATSPDGLATAISSLMVAVATTFSAVANGARARSGVTARTPMRVRRCRNANAPIRSKPATDAGAASSGRNRTSMPSVWRGRAWKERAAPPISTPPPRPFARSREAVSTSGTMIDPDSFRVPSSIARILDRSRGRPAGHRRSTWQCPADLCNKLPLT
jgi:hypothetical protein